MPMFRLTSRREWMKGGVAAAVGAAAVRGLNAVDFEAQARPLRANSAGPIRLCFNENPYGPSAKALAAMRESLGAGNRYANQLYGYPELEEMIAAREGLTREHVVLGSGSGEILCMAAVAFGLGRGGIVAAELTFPVLMSYAERIGARVTRVPLDERFAHDLGAMEARATAGAGLVYVCNPNNPTGTVLPPERLRDFCERVSRRAAVLVDEAYYEYVEPPHAATMVELVRSGLDVIVVRTFSKIYGLAGMRVGYCLARPDLAARLRAFRMSMLNQSGLKAAAASYGDEEFVRLSRRRNNEARNSFCEELRATGLDYVPSHANFVYVRFGVENRAAPRSLAQRGFLVNGDGSPLAGEWARVSVGTPAEMSGLAAAMRAVMKVGTKVG